LGRDSYRLEKNKTVATVLIFKLHKKCLYGLDQRQGAQPYKGGLEDIRHLAPDFLNISRKAKQVAQAEAQRLLGKSGWQYAFWRLVFSLFLPVAGGFVGAYLIDHLSLERDLVKVTATVEGLEKMVDFQTQQSEVQLETTLNQNISTRALRGSSVKLMSSARPLKRHLSIPSYNFLVDLGNLNLAWVGG
jgi:hypothetical protein